ncbi:MAG: hypothetical protein KKH17_11610 [Proteobacteria bacterium]|nr:hypothetical protein [Pseudomonadota bacterium]MCG2829675.1 hypothetical protein [Desulfobacteraceae bacterium]
MSQEQFLNGDFLKPINLEFLKRLMSEQFLLALCFTQIGQIPTGNGGDCRWLLRKFLQCHHNSFFPFILSIQNSYFPTPHPKRFDSLVYDTSFINQFPMTPFIAFLQGLNIDLTFSSINRKMETCFIEIFLFRI